MGQAAGSAAPWLTAVAWRRGSGGSLQARLASDEFPRADRSPVAYNDPMTTTPGGIGHWCRARIGLAVARRFWPRAGRAMLDIGPRGLAAAELAEHARVLTLTATSPLEDQVAVAPAAAGLISAGSMRW
jgi:hypothetical protein